MPLEQRDVSESLRLLPNGYTTLFERLRKVCLDDERVRAMWLGGSIARRDQDQSSDLDVFLAIADSGFEAFAADWRAWLASITPTVIARPLPFAPGSLYSVTPTMERLDIVSEPVHALTSTFHRTRLLVFQKDPLGDLIPAPTPGAGPSTVAIAAHIEEFFRDYSMFHTVVDRQDWLLGLEAIHRIRTLLYLLFMESNAPLPNTGIKRWSEKLTFEQRTLLESLPAAHPTRSEVIEVHETVSLAFRRSAFEITARLAIDWPTELERQVCESLKARDLPHLE